MKFIDVPDVKPPAPMKIESDDAITVGANRVRVAWMTLRGRRPEVGDIMTRADGEQWTVLGVGQYARLGGANEGEPISLLLVGAAEWKVGDELTVR